MRAPRWARTPGARAILGGAIAVIASAPAIARAEPPRVTLYEDDVTLEYRRGPSTTECPDEAAFRLRTADAFEFHDPFVAPGVRASGSLRVHITREGRHFHGTLTVLDADGEPAASSAERHTNCDALVWVLAHRAAIAVLRKPEPPPPPAPPPQPPATPPSSGPSPSAPPSPSPSARPSPACDARCIDDVARRLQVERVHFRSYSAALSGGALLTVGLTPDPGAGLWLGAALQSKRFSVGIEARGAFRAPALTFASGRSSEISWLSGVLVPCVRWRLLRGCGFLEAGVADYKVPGDIPSVAEPLVAVGPRVGVDLPIARGVLFRVFGDVAVRVLTPRFTVRLGPEDDAPVQTWAMPQVSGIVGAGIAWSG